MLDKDLRNVVLKKSFEDYAQWWPVGSEFTSFMSEAMHCTWLELANNSGDLSAVDQHITIYLSTVYEKKPAPNLVQHFAENDSSIELSSGEFDAISYAYHRSAFELIEKNIDQYSSNLVEERLMFTKKAGKLFFDQVCEYLSLDLPGQLSNSDDFLQLKHCISDVGSFLQEQGYLRDHFAFHFDVSTSHQGVKIQQTDESFLEKIKSNSTGYALYEMGYPSILPSAVYLYHTIGEAQHHSSRTIEELFSRVGYTARETDDFDPIGYPSDMVVELWEIEKTL